MKPATKINEIMVFIVMTNDRFCIEYGVEMKRNVLRVLIKIRLLVYRVEQSNKIWERSQLH